MTRLPPVRLIETVTAARSALHRLSQRTVPPEVGLLDLASGFMATHAIYAAARLGIADTLAGGARSADEIAAEAGSDPDRTHRLLRACATYGVFRERPDGRFELTRLATGLRSGTANSVRPLVLMLGDPQYQLPWGQLTQTVTTGIPGAEQVFGKPFWEHLRDDPAFAATFDHAMTCATAMDWPTVDAVYDFTPFSTIVDLAGGRGRLLASMLGAAPLANGVLLERNELIDDAADQLRSAGVLDRCRLETGSLFGTVTSDGDLYVMRRVIHDFDDDQAVTILANVGDHMPSGSTLLLMESVVRTGNAQHFAKTLDLDMMIFVGGRERTEQQFATLLERAGFHLTRMIPTISTITLIEARK